MRLGLIGTGKQGQRYLLEKNGGRHIKVSGSRRIPLDDVDGVIIATHPAGHKELALECIAAGKAVLIEKPLALNLRDCMDIIDAAAKAEVRFRTANPCLWDDSFDWVNTEIEMAAALYRSHDRDYSPWLDWGPHVIAIAHQAGGWTRSDNELRSLVSVSHAPAISRSFVVASGGRENCRPWSYCSLNGMNCEKTPMANVVADFVEGISDDCEEYEFNRRVYRALFAED